MASVEAEEAVASEVVAVVASVEAEAETVEVVAEIAVVAVDVEALMLTKTLTLEALLLSREPRCPSECRPDAAV